MHLNLSLSFKLNWLGELYTFQGILIIECKTRKTHTIAYCFQEFFSSKELLRKLSVHFWKCVIKSLKNMLCHERTFYQEQKWWTCFLCRLDVGLKGTSQANLQWRYFKMGQHTFTIPLPTQKIWIPLLLLNIIIYVIYVSLFRSRENKGNKKLN